MFAGLFLAYLEVNRYFLWFSGKKRFFLNLFIAWLHSKELTLCQSSANPLPFYDLKGSLLYIGPPNHPFQLGLGWKVDSIAWAAFSYVMFKWRLQYDFSWVFFFFSIYKLNYVRTKGQSCSLLLQDIITTKKKEFGSWKYIFSELFRMARQYSNAHTHSIVISVGGFNGTVPPTAYLAVCYVLQTYIMRIKSQGFFHLLRSLHR